MTKYLHYKNLCARWISKALIDVEKLKHMGAALVSLQRYTKEGNDFLKSIVTGYETWIRYDIYL